MKKKLKSTFTGGENLNFRLVKYPYFTKNFLFLVKFVCQRGSYPLATLLGTPVTEILTFEFPLITTSEF